MKKIIVFLVILLSVAVIMNVHYRERIKILEQINRINEKTITLQYQMIEGCRRSHGDKKEFFDISR